MARFTRPLALGDTGADVEGVNRAYVRAGFLLARVPAPIRVFNALPAKARRRFNKSSVNAANKLKKAEGWKPTNRHDFENHLVLESSGAFDARAEALLKGWKPEPPKLVEPNQGWDSLHRSLWEAYSEARRRGFTDLGTYANKPGDHGYRPSWAFDVGHESRFNFLGWGYLKARRLAKWYAKNYVRLNIRYVILGNRIWHRNTGRWGPFSNYERDKSHDFHIHVSGQRG